MKKNNSIYIIMGVLAIMSFCSLILVVYPAFIPQLDLSTNETANIGSTLGGVIGPIVSMFSAYLIYEALMAQQEGNKVQRLKGDTDIIFLLFNQLDKEYDSLHFKNHSGNDFYGYYALAEYCILIKKVEDKEIAFKTFRGALPTNQLLYIIRSFTMIRNHIFQSSFTNDVEIMLQKKLEIYYRSKFKFPIKHIVEAFHDREDDYIFEIKEFQKINDVM